jgi:hypothetical protein
MTAPLRVHVLYESSSGEVPHGCSEIRLLRPLAHPALEHDVSLTFGLALPREPVDVLIVERLWDHSCDWDLHRRLLMAQRRQGATLIFEIDDDLLSLNTEAGVREWPEAEQRMWLRQITRFADGVIVTTANLAHRLEALARCVEVVPNALDEKLFGPSRSLPASGAEGSPVVCGYMGTLTHLEDLLSVIHPLRRTLAQQRGRLRFEMVGIGETALLQDLFDRLPATVRLVPIESVPYARFAAWMQTNLRWDFAIAPLIDTRFSRSKSDIKFLDYGVQGMPGIFANVPAYAGTVVHEGNGLLAGDPSTWETCLLRLATDGGLRSRLRERAHGEIWRQRMLATQAPQWLAAIRRIRDRALERRAGSAAAQARVA